jgi:hypothetical protein
MTARFIPIIHGSNPTIKNIANGKNASIGIVCNISIIGIRYFSAVFDRDIKIPIKNARNIDIPKAINILTQE